MTKTLKSIAVLLVAFATLAFTPSKRDHALDVTYGVCEGNPAQIELRLTEDNQFYYQDLSVQSNKIKVTGMYTIRKNRIDLTPTEPSVKFHSSWKISDDGSTAKSRKGLCFYTLKKLK